MACSPSLALVAVSPVVLVHNPAASRTLPSPSANAQCSSCRAASFANSCSLQGTKNRDSLSNSPWQRTRRRNPYRSARVIAKAVESGETALSETKWGPPIQLATGKIPDDVDLKLFENLLYQWGSSLTVNANLPLPVPLKVDRIAGGVRLGYVKVVDAAVEEVCHIDVVVFPKSDDEPKAMMRALRNGKLKDTTPPAEPLIMQSLLQALKTAVARSRTQQ